MQNGSSISISQNVLSCNIFIDKKWAQKFEKFELPILFMSWQLQPLLLPLHWEDGHSCFLEFRREPTTKSSETEHFNLLAFCLDNGFLTMAYSPVALWPRQFVPGFLTAAICSLLAPYPPPWDYINTNIMFAVYLQHQNTGSNQFAITKLFAKSELVDHECWWKTFTLISGFISLYFCSWNWYGVVWYGGACIWLKVVWFLSNCFMAAAAFCFVWFASIRAYQTFYSFWIEHKVAAEIKVHWLFDITLRHPLSSQLSILFYIYFNPKALKAWISIYLIYIRWLLL